MDKSKSNPSWVCVLTYPFLFVIRCRYCGFDPLFCVMVVLRVLIWTPNFVNSKKRRSKSYIYIRAKIKPIFKSP